MKHKIAFDFIHSQTHPKYVGVKQLGRDWHGKFLRKIMSVSCETKDFLLKHVVDRKNDKNNHLLEQQKQCPETPYCWQLTRMNSIFDYKQFSLQKLLISLIFDTQQ